MAKITMTEKEILEMADRLWEADSKAAESMTKSTPEKEDKDGFHGMRGIFLALVVAAVAFVAVALAGNAEAERAAADRGHTIVR